MFAWTKSEPSFLHSKPPFSTPVMPCSTLRSKLDIAFEKLRTQQDPEDDSFDITDVEGRTLMHVPFSEVLRPRRATKIPMVYRNRQAIAACHREIVGSQTLKAELRVEFEKTQCALEVTRTNLARMWILARRKAFHSRRPSVFISAGWRAWYLSNIPRPPSGGLSRIFAARTCSGPAAPAGGVWPAVVILCYRPSTSSPSD
jgi:hypothetical protein